VPSRDARSLIGRSSLDKEGFALLHHQTAVTNFYDEQQIKTVYYPECERMMQAATGAVRVVAFDHIVRNAAMAAIKSSGIKTPAKRVHNDYTAWSSPKRVRDLMGDEAEELLKHRYAIINLWRPIRSAGSPARSSGLGCASGPAARIGGVLTGVSAARTAAKSPIHNHCRTARPRSAAGSEPCRGRNRNQIAFSWGRASA
jgi:hypothetical protein